MGEKKMDVRARKVFGQEFVERPRVGGNEVEEDEDGGGEGVGGLRRRRKREKINV